MVAFWLLPEGVHAQGELRRVFEQILQSPNDLNLNFRYARLVLERGELRKALAAYERILFVDPDNEEAKAGVRRIQRLLKPDFTDVIALIGAQYESNPQRFNDSFSDTEDYAFFGRVQGTDERRINDWRWRTDGDVFASLHTEFSDIDFGNVGVRTGPVLEIFEGWLLRPAVGGAYAWLDNDKFFVEGSVFLNFEADNGGAFKNFNIQASYNDIGGAVSDLDAYSIEVNPRFVFTNVVAENDSLILNPRYRYNGVIGEGAAGTGARGETFPLRYHQIGTRADYFFRLTDNVVSGVNMFVEYQLFNEQVVSKSKDRRDLYLVPGVQIIVSEVLLGNHDVIIGYHYERNLSNDDAEDFENHTSGVTSLWRF